MKSVKVNIKKTKFNETYSNYDGTAKNFWRDIINAHNEDEAKELKRLMDASSLSHAQAQRLMVYALRNCSDEGFLFIKRNLLKDFYGAHTLNKVIQFLSVLLELSTEERIDQILEKLGAAPENASSKFCTYLLQCNEEDLKRTINFVSSFCVDHPFRSLDEVDEMNDLGYTLYKAQMQMDEVVDNNIASLMKQGAIEETTEILLNRPIERLKDSKEYLLKVGKAVDLKIEKLKSETGEEVSIYDMGADLPSVIKEMEKDNGNTEQ